MKIDKLMNEWKKALCNDMDLTPVIEEIGTRKLLDILLDNVGNIDSLTRENVLNAFWVLAWNKPVLSHEEYIHALNTSLSDTHLFKGIGGEEDDSAFWRSFASNFAMWVIKADVKQGFLSEEQYVLTLNKAIEYMVRERDRRGFVFGKGTVHAIPHGTGLIEACVEHPRFTNEFVPQILDMIKCCVIDKSSFGVDWADYGIAHMILPLLDKGVKEEAIKDWIENLLPKVEAVTYTDAHYPYVLMGSYIEHFLMFLYFELRKGSRNEGLREWVFDYISKLRQKVYN